MAKPVDIIPEWADASNAGNYVGGPFAGQPRKVSIPAGIAAEGFRPGANDPSAAEHINDYLNQASKWIRWVFDGSSAGAANAHLVETNSVGSTSLQHLRILGLGSPGQVGLQINGPTGAPALNVIGHPTGSNTAAIVANQGLGIGLEVTNSNPGNGQPAGKFTGPTGVQATGLDAGVGLLATGGPDAESAAIVLPAAGATNQGGLLALGKGNKPGIDSTGGATAPGVIGRGGGAAQPGVRGEGGAGAPGLLGQGGSGGAAGVEGYGTLNEPGVYGEGVAGGRGVRGQSENAEGVFGASENHVGVFGSGPIAGVRGNSTIGAAGDFFSVDGEAGKFEAEGEKATTVHVERGSDPTDFEDGGMWYRSNVGMKVRRKGATRILHDSAKGRCLARAFSSAGSTSNDWSNPVLIATLNLTGADAPTTAGDVYITVVADIGRTGTCSFNLAVEDVTAGTSEDTHSIDPIQLFQSGAGVYERTIAWTTKYTLPATGNRQFNIYFSREDGAGGDIVRYRRAKVQVDGVY